MGQDAIVLTDRDWRRLRRLVDLRASGDLRQAADVAGLERRLEEAEVRPAARIGPDVVTMNSRVRVTDLDTGERLAFQVVFPPGGGASTGRISVTAPLGLAVIGARAGEEITWEAPGGLRRLRVDAVEFQPEREGRDLD